MKSWQKKYCSLSPKKNTKAYDLYHFLTFKILKKINSQSKAPEKVKLIKNYQRLVKNMVEEQQDWIY